MSDLISRQAALDTFGLSEKSRKYGGDHSGYDTIMLYEVQDALEALPSADPVKHGRWIDTGEIFTDQFSLDEFPIYECSVCGSRIERKPTLDRFCNWCGARMDGDEHEID